MKHVALVAVVAVSLASCSSGVHKSDAPHPLVYGSAISANRCKSNEAAGKITFITGYRYQASMGVLEDIAAKQLGYFDALCLDVDIKPGTGDTAQNAQLTAAGTAQMTSLGNNSEVLSAIAGGVNVTGVATMGHVPIATLLTMPSVTKLTQLDGTTLGQKGSLPAPIRSMLVKAGVNVSSIKQVVVGYDPSVLPRGQVQSLTGYKSNEPLLLAQRGVKFTQWNPENYGVVGSFGTYAVNPAFASAHPTAVEDYLRAMLHALDYCRSNTDTCVSMAASLAGSGYDIAHNEQVWKTETDLVTSSTGSRKIGFLDFPAIAAEGATLVASGQVSSVPSPQSAFNPIYLAAAQAGAAPDSSARWPAP